MRIIDKIKNRARALNKTIVLPESDDIRTLKASEIVIREGFAKIILIGNADDINKIAIDNNINIYLLNI